jgi:hypothetical protein
MKYKKGDVIYCLKDFRMTSGEISYSKGKTYIIKEILSGGEYNVIDNQNTWHSMSDLNLEHFVLDKYAKRMLKLERVLK